MDIAALLKQLSQTPGLSGHEAEIRSVVRTEWGRRAAETRVDKVGNALAIRRGAGRAAALYRSIMLATHMDEIGLMVAGVKHGFSYGQTDAYGYNVADEKGEAIQPDKHKFTPGAVHVHDLQATILHLMGIDHTRLTFKFQGRRYRLTDVHGHVVEDVLA